MKWKNWVAICGAAVLFLTVSAASAANLTPTRSASESLEPGLEVIFHFGDFSSIGALLTKAASESPKIGEPIANLDHRGGGGKGVLGLRHRDFVGAIITGYMLFPEAGTYNLRVRSNDGIRLELGGELIFEDPRTHADRNSPTLPVVVTEAGWVPLRTVYFERKGSWSLQVYWSQGGEFVPIPAANFGH